MQATGINHNYSPAEKNRRNNFDNNGVMENGEIRMLAVILGKMRQLIFIIFLGLCISCSDKEEISIHKCFNDFFAGSKDCNANYFDTALEPSLQTDTYNFDLNGDNQTDISFDPEIGGSPYQEWLHSDQTLFYLNVTVNLGINCCVYLNDLSEPDTVSYGKLFKNLKNWNNLTNKYIISSFETVSEFSDLTGPVKKTYYSGTFYDTRNKYLLFRLSLKNDTTLAWFNLNCTKDGNLKIIEYAYLKK